MPLHPKRSHFGGRSAFRVDDIPATAASIGAVRREFATWVGGTVHTTKGRLSDIILVVYEALVNAVEYTNLESDCPAKISMLARYTHKTRSLNVTVQDDGHGDHHQRPADDNKIDLIRALCDQPVITSTDGSTEIDLSWTLFA